MADVPLPAPACIVTTLGSHRPQHFMLSTSRGVALMEKPIGSTLNLFADDQMHAHAAAVTAAKDAEIAALRAELAKHQESEFHPDWSMLAATRASLKEHQQMIRELRAEAAQLRQYLDTAQRRASVLGDEVAGLREDAERYRWLRDESHEYFQIVIHPGRYVDGAEADAAIDAALAARKGTT